MKITPEILRKGIPEMFALTSVTLYPQVEVAVMTFQFICFKQPCFTQFTQYLAHG